MPQLLVSVRNSDEAAIALAAGVDLIDVKEPGAGSLGAASVEVINDVHRKVNGRRPISVALGELVDGPAARAHGLAARCPEFPPDFAKIGLAHCARRSTWSEELKAALSTLPNTTARVAVAYADFEAAAAPSPNEILKTGKSCGCTAALLDTYDKRGPGLLRLWSPRMINRWICSARDAGMLAVVAGQLSIADCAAACEWKPDFIAVRGAVCRPDRCGQIDSGRIAQLQTAIAHHSALAVENRDDHRPLDFAARNMHRI